MNNNEQKAIQQDSSARRVLRLAAALSVLALVGCVLATWLVNRYVVFSIEQGKGQPSVLVHTPFGYFPSGPSNADSWTLWSAVYPKSVWDEENETDFYHGATGNEEETAQLTVLRFHSPLALVQVDKWYRQRLGESFARSKGWPISLNEHRRKDWLQSIGGSTNPETLVYRQELPGRARGVLLESQPDGNGVLATLYEFQEGRR